MCTIIPLLDPDIKAYYNNYAHIVESLKAYHMCIVESLRHHQKYVGRGPGLANQISKI